MNKNSSYIVLSLYFFCYLIPQYIPNVLLAYDRAIVQLFFISILNLFSVYWILKKKKVDDIISSFKLKNHLISYCIFISIGFISLIVAENFISGVFELTQLLNFFIAYLVIVIISSNKNIKILRYFILVTLFAILIESFTINYLVYNSVITNGEFLSRSNDFSGIAANINIAAFSLMMKLSVPIYLIFKEKNYIILTISSLLIYSSFLSVLILMSRGAIIALFFVFISILLFVLLSRNRIILIKAFGIFFMFYLSILSYNILNEKNVSDILLDRFSTVSNPQTDESVNERLNFFLTAIESIKKRPLLGIGIGNWKIKSIDYSKDIIQGYRVPYFVHNDFLQFTAEIGLVGGISFFYFIFFPFYITIREFLKSKSYNSFILIFMIFGVYIIDSMINFPAHRPINFIFLFFSIAIFYKRISIKKDYE